MNTILKMENVSKIYNGNTVLNIKNLEIEEKSIYGLIGPNGAGKSTLMKIILGLVKKNSGKVTIFNEEVSNKNQKEINKYLGALIENPSFYDHLNAYDNLYIICKLKNINPNEIKKVLEIVGLSNVSNKKVKDFSLGMKQRIGIAMALIGNPKLLILDEPINGLDPYGIEEMRILFQNIVEKTNTSILISSHLLDEIEKISTHIGILKKGEFIYNGTLEKYREMHPPYISIKTSNNFEAANILNLSMKNIINDSLMIGKVSNEKIARIINLLNDKVDIYRITEEKESLEKLFIKETNGGNNEKYWINKI